MGHSAEDHDHSPMGYIKIWAILLVLLIISIIGPELGIKTVTLITAFGIAIVKAVMVAAYFMHLNIEKKFIWYLFGIMMFFMVAFIAGTQNDIMAPSGHNWENKAGLEIIEKNKDWHDKLDKH